MPWSRGGAAVRNEAWTVQVTAGKTVSACRNTNALVGG